MHIPEQLLWAVWKSDSSHPGLCGLQIICDEKKRKQIDQEFRHLLKAEYYVERSAVDFAYCDPLLEEIIETEYGLCVKLGALSMFVTDEMCISPCCCCVDETVEGMIAKNKDIQIHGYIGYAWKDDFNQGLVQYAIGDKNSGNQNGENEVLYDFIGQKLAAAMEKDRFFEYFEDHKKDISAEEKKEIIDYMDMYHEFLAEEKYQKLKELF